MKARPRTELPYYKNIYAQSVGLSLSSFYMFYLWFLEDSKNAFGQQRSYLALELFAMQDDLEEVKDHIIIMQEIC